MLISNSTSWLTRLLFLASNHASPLAAAMMPFGHTGPLPPPPRPGGYYIAAMFDIMFMAYL